MTKRPAKRYQRYLREMIAERGSECQSCGIEVVQICSIKIANRIKQTSRYLTFKDEDGEEHVKAIATIEHVILRSKGGADSKENMRVFCAKCNRLANAAHQPKKRKKCKRCGAKLGSGRARFGQHCGDCHEILREPPLKRYL